MSANFEERRNELDVLISEFLHELCGRGLAVTTDAGAASNDREDFVEALAQKLEKGLDALPPRTSARTLTEIVIQVAVARLRTVVSLAAGLSATERASLATLLRLSEQERRTLGTILRLRREERGELARVFGLSNLECQVLAAFVNDQHGEVPEDFAPSKSRTPAGSR
jgi:hypothetical protein